MILNKKTINELKKDFIVCKFCNKKISLKNKRKDMLIGFKSHLRQKHKISLNEYYNLKSKDLCLFCKKNPTNIIISKNQNSKVFIVNYSLCNDKNCINMRKKLNPNSAKYVSIINNCSEKEALKIIHNKNNSPFYKENFLTKEEYLYSQKTYSN